MRISRRRFAIPSAADVAGGVAIVLLNRDLRIHDHPALAAACAGAEAVVPLFVLDERLLSSPRASPNRIRFLHESLAALGQALQDVGGRLVVRRGDPVAETLRIASETGAQVVHASRDVSSGALAREAALSRACAEAGIGLALQPGVTVVPADEPRTTTGGTYRVFTPFWRAWEAVPRRPLAPAPARVTLPPVALAGELPALEALTTGPFSPDTQTGGEPAARRLLAMALEHVLPRYGTQHDTLAGNTSSRLSAALHFGCVSPLEVEQAARDVAGSEAFVRQLAWRDFHHHTTLSFPSIGHEDLRPRGTRWQRDDDELDAWREGLTGYPIVDAGMRQLLQEGWLPGRARMIVATFLTKHLGHDWREGERHFARWLIDGDVANNAANWQWVAGTGSDTRPGRILNPMRQAERFDRDGEYVRRYLPELAHLDRRVIHTPWLLPADERGSLGYPDRLVDHEVAAAAFRLRGVTGSSTRASEGSLSATKR